MIEQIFEWYNTSPLAPRGGASGEGSKLTQFLSTLAQSLVEIMIYGEEIEQRNGYPWLDELESAFAIVGQHFRSLALEDVAIQIGVDESLRSLADDMEKVETHRHAIGRESWSLFRNYVKESVYKARQIKEAYIDTTSLSRESIDDLQDAFRKCVRRLKDLDARSERMASEGRIEEVQTEANQIGKILLQVGYYSILKTEEFNAILREIGRALHLLVTERVRLDGGASLKRIVSRLHELNEQLANLASALD